jgi:hypothetical protein
MPKYYVETLVKYSGEVEADTEEEAEQKGWNFSNTYDGDVLYECVERIDVEEVYDYDDSDEEADELEEELV